jgi:hypothetical protein
VDPAGTAAGKSLIPGLRREESVTAISFHVEQLEDEWDD